MRFIKRIKSEAIIFEQNGGYWLTTKTKFGEVTKRITLDKYLELQGS